MDMHGSFIYSKVADKKKSCITYEMKTVNLYVAVGCISAKIKKQFSRHMSEISTNILHNFSRLRQRDATHRSWRGEAERRNISDSNHIREC